MGKLLGKDAKLYRGEAGTTATVLVENIKDLTVNMERGDADATTRASGDFKQSESTLITASFDFEMLVDEADEDYAAFRAAFIANTALAIKVLSKLGGVGVDCDCKVFKFEESQPLEDIQKVSVTLKPCTSERQPTFVSASGSASAGV